MSGLTEIELKQQIGELLNIRDALSQKLRAAQHESEALAATVEALREAYKKISSKITDIDDTETDSEEIADALWQDLFNELREGYQLCNTTPQQNLRDVEAKAGRAGFIAGWVSWSAKGDVKVRSDNYAASVRDGEK